jgi:hypothetical protein
MDTRKVNRKLLLMGFFSMLIFLITLSGFFIASHYRINELLTKQVMPDLSGLVWVQDDLFIGIHDAKNDSLEKGLPRVSMIRLPASGTEGLRWNPVNPRFPIPDGLSGDLEGAAGIPGTREILFAESGQQGEKFSRIYHARVDEDGVSILSVKNWPVGIENVEAIAVCSVNQQLVFVYAERSEGLDSTLIRWCNLSVFPLGFGEFKEVVFHSIDPVGPGSRPVAAMDTDREGHIIISSSYDPDSDNGPYRSVIWQIGKMAADSTGNPTVLLEVPVRLATLDGLKVESIAIRQVSGSERQLFIGTDDENYGGTIRLLPL